MKKDINRLQFPKPIIWEGTMLDKAKADLFFMDAVAIKREVIEFTVAQVSNTGFTFYLSTSKSLIDKDLLERFTQEMFLNLREQYGN
jgi:hypothetical protein